MWHARRSRDGLFLLKGFLMRTANRFAEHVGKLDTNYYPRSAQYRDQAAAPIAEASSPNLAATTEKVSAKAGMV